MVHVAEDDCDGRTNGHIGEGSISPSGFPMSVLNHDFFFEGSPVARFRRGRILMILS